MFLAYVAGSLPTGKIAGYVYGIDIQKRGSGNIGFANVRRILGWRVGIVVLIVDILKGFIPTAAAIALGLPASAAFWVGYCSIMGHVYPVWLRFHGGKGMATGLGVVACLHPIAAGMGAAIYVAGCTARLRSSTSSLAGIIILVTVLIADSPTHWWQAAILLATALFTLRRNLFGTLKDYEQPTSAA